VKLLMSESTILARESESMSSELYIANVGVRNMCGAFVKNNDSCLCVKKFANFSLYTLYVFAIWFHQVVYV